MLRKGTQGPSPRRPMGQSDPNVDKVISNYFSGQRRSSRQFHLGMGILWLSAAIVVAMYAHGAQPDTLSSLAAFILETLGLNVAFFRSLGITQLLLKQITFLTNLYSLALYCASAFSVFTAGAHLWLSGSQGVKSAPLPLSDQQRALLGLGASQSTQPHADVQSPKGVFAREKSSGGRSPTGQAYRHAEMDHHWRDGGVHLPPRYVSHPRSAIKPIVVGDRLLEGHDANQNAVGDGGNQQVTTATGPTAVNPNVVIGQPLNPFGSASPTYQDQQIYSPVSPYTSPLRQQMNQTGGYQQWVNPSAQYQSPFQQGQFQVYPSPGSPGSTQGNLQGMTGMDGNRPFLPAYSQMKTQAYGFDLQSPTSPTLDKGDLAVSAKDMAADVTLRDLGVSARTLEEWCNRLRIWLSARIFRPLAASFELLQHRDELRKAVQEGKMDVQSATNYLASIRHQLARSYGLFQEVQLNEIPETDIFIEDEARLQLYLDVSHGRATAIEIARRIIELARGDRLAAYRWDHTVGEDSSLTSPSYRSDFRPGNGLRLGLGKGVPETTADANAAQSRKGPSDADLVIHLFSTYMDIKLPSSGGLSSPNRGNLSSSSMRPFMSTYVLDQSLGGDNFEYSEYGIATLGNSLQSVARIRRTSSGQKSRPYFDILPPASETHTGKSSKKPTGKENDKSHSNAKSPTLTSSAVKSPSTGTVTAATASQAKEVKVWACHEGRKNALEVICLFLYYYKTKRSGFIQNLNMTGPYTGLMDVIDPSASVHAGTQRLMSSTIIAGEPRSATKGRPSHT
eukprot:Clim_evm45s243 gene=Clim_evmTU45s243